MGIGYSEVESRAERQLGKTATTPGPWRVIREEATLAGEWMVG